MSFISAYKRPTTRKRRELFEEYNVTKNNWPIKEIILYFLLNSEEQTTQNRC